VIAVAFAVAVVHAIVPSRGPHHLCLTWYCCIESARQATVHELGMNFEIRCSFLTRLRSIIIIKVCVCPRPSVVRRFKG
jgi:hypothetical protein